MPSRVRRNSVTVFSAPGFPSVTSVPFNIPGPPSPILGVTGNTNYGSVCIGSLASQTYTITNTGTVAASGVSVVSSNNSEFTVSGLSSTTIAGNGGTATYNVTFNPSAAGTRTSTVTVTSTTSGSNSVVNNLTGTGVTAINGA
ncbi:MAG: choice-of-anchor D domain-containing protein, partial [Pedobacter sp.]